MLRNGIVKWLLSGPVPGACSLAKLHYLLPIDTRQIENQADVLLAALLLVFDLCGDSLGL